MIFSLLLTSKGFYHVFLFIYLFILFSVILGNFLINPVVKEKIKVKFALDVINYFKELPFYETYIEKPKIKHLKNIDLFSEHPFYEVLSVVKTDKAFRRYAITYKVELIDKKGPLSQLEASKSSITDI